MRLLEEPDIGTSREISRSVSLIYSQKILYTALISSGQSLRLVRTDCQAEVGKRGLKKLVIYVQMEHTGTYVQNKTYYKHSFQSKKAMVISPSGKQNGCLIQCYIK